MTLIREIWVFYYLQAEWSCFCSQLSGCSFAYLWVFSLSKCDMQIQDNGAANLYLFAQMWQMLLTQCVHYTLHFHLHECVCAERVEVISQRRCVKDLSVVAACGTKTIILFSEAQFQRSALTVTMTDTVLHEETLTLMFCSWLFKKKSPDATNKKQNDPIFTWYTQKNQGATSHWEKWRLRKSLWFSLGENWSNILTRKCFNHTSH